MANRFPLTINNSSTLVGELPNGDSLNLAGSGIYDGTSLGAAGEVLKSTGSSLQWSRAADVFKDDTQTILNKTFSSCVFNCLNNTLTNVTNASLVNSSININGNDVSLGGSIVLNDSNDNTLYSISVAAGPDSSSKRIRLTAGGSGSGVQDIFIAQGDNVTITKNTSNDTLTIASALTKLRANTGTYVEGSISFTGSGGTSVSRSGQTFTIASDLFPSGGIIMWSGSTSNIPSGWVLCNGNNSTPDLRNRFVIGAGDDFNVGSTGGSRDAVLVSHDHTATTSAQSADHTHGGTTDNNNRGHKHDINNLGTQSASHSHSGNSGNQNASHSHNASASNANANHSHNGNTGNQNSSHSHSGNTSNPTSNHRHGYSKPNTGTNHDGEGNSISLSRGNFSNQNTGGITSDHKHNFNTGNQSSSHSHNVNTNSANAGHSHPVNVGNQSASHSHSVNVGNQSASHNHSGETQGISQNHTHTFNTGNQSAGHTHTLTTSSEGVTATNKNMPPYYALCYIMKT